MSYLTTYTLTCDTNAMIEELRQENEAASIAFNELGEPFEKIGWFTWREDLQEFSKKHPDDLFILEGDGEDTSDLWKCYFKNGKSQKAWAKITYDEFDPEQLIEFEDKPPF